MNNSDLKKAYAKDRDQEDLIAAGFHKLDSKLVSKNPPKISWGELYKANSRLDKIIYLEKLCSSMNQAAHLIQGERDQLLKLCGNKEKQLVQMSKSVEANNQMLQTELTKVNVDKQYYNKRIATLNAKIRELENGDNN